MATYRICTTHGIYEGKICPDCPKPTPPKKSKKYGGQTVIIPPHMRAT